MLKEISKHRTFFVYCKRYCPRRSLEATKLYEYLVANDFHPVGDAKEADLIFVYTCGGFDLDEKFSLLTVQKALKNKSARTIVTGCLTKIDPGKLEPFRDVIVQTPDELPELDSLLGARVPYDNFPNASVVAGVHDLYHGSLLSRIRRNMSLDKLVRVYRSYVGKRVLRKVPDSVDDPRVYRLEIAKGCLGACTYCAIKRAMPKFHSFPEDQILANFRKGLSLGYKTFAIFAGDIGCYGVDIGTSLPALLKKLFQMEGDHRFILVDLNPYWLVKYGEDLLNILKTNSQKIVKIIVPIQSGSNRILELMKRNYRIEDVRRLLLDLKSAIPPVIVETHILVGFPGETEEDFLQSANLIKEVPFSTVAVYKYEDRPNTRASEYPEKISKEIAEKRIRRLKKIVECAVIN